MNQADKGERIVDASSNKSSKLEQNNHYFVRVKRQAMSHRQTWNMAEQQSQNMR